jgi:hypothetical protein
MSSLLRSGASQGSASSRGWRAFRTQVKEPGAGVSSFALRSHNPAATSPGEDGIDAQLGPCYFCPPMPSLERDYRHAVLNHTVLLQTETDRLRMVVIKSDLVNLS